MPRDRFYILGMVHENGKALELGRADGCREGA